MTTNEALLALKAIRDKLTRQQVRTIRGQIIAGDIEAAMRGIEKIERRTR